jgi:hypothetical protein
MAEEAGTAPTREALETLVAEADIGGRKPTGASKIYISLSRLPGRSSSSGTHLLFPTSSTSG